MAESKLTDQILLTPGNAAADDLVYIVDVSDTSGGAAGTSKKATITTLMGRAPVVSVNGETGAVSLDSTEIKRIGTTGDSVDQDLTAAENNINAIKAVLKYPSATTTGIQVDTSNKLEIDSTNQKAIFTINGSTAATFGPGQSLFPQVRIGTTGDTYDLPITRGTNNGEVPIYDAATNTSEWRTLGTSALSGNSDGITEGTTNLFLTSAERTKLGSVTSGAAVASVSGTAPIVSSGGTTPAISITAATTSAAGSMSSADKSKLDGIQAGAQVNAVTSVNTQTGAVVLTTANITENTNLYYTDARFDTRFGTKSTTNLTEGTNLYFTNARADARTFAEKDQILQGQRNVDLNGDGVEFHATGPVIFGVDTSGIYATGLILFNGLYYPSANGVAGQSITTDGTATLTMGHPYSQVITKSATAITLALSDAGKYIRCTGATSITVTIPQNIFAVGHEILIEQTSSTAQVTIAAGTGVTLRNSGNFLLKTSEQYSIVGLKCVATNEFILTGERELA